MLVIAFIVAAVAISLVTWMVLGAMLINALVVLGVHVFAVVFTARRARGIPLYWIIAVFSALASCFVVMFAWHPIVAPEPADASATKSWLELSGLGHAFAYWRLWTTSWPVLTGMAGAIVSVGMSYSSRPLVRALAGVAWGAAAMTIFSRIYHPGV